MSRRYRPFDPFERYEPSIREINFPRPPRRFWIGLGLIGLALLILLIAAPIITFFTDTQWYRALGLGDVYLTRVWLQVALFLGALIVAFLFATANVVVALRFRSWQALRAMGIRRPVVRSLAGGIGVGLAAILALILSGGAGTQWQSLLLFMHYNATGVTEPVYGLDVSFYLLTLPFLHSVVNWSIGLIFTTGLLSVGLYAWRGDTFDFRLNDRALAHLSILLGLLAVAVGASTYLGRYDLLYSHNGFVWGAGYADVNARIQVATLQAILAILLAVPLFLNVLIRARAVMPVAAVVIWVAGVLIGSIYPASVQRLAVQPSELTQEQPYIQREIQFTRKAFNLDQIATQDFGGTGVITSKEVADDQTTINNLRLWDDRPLKATYQQLQSFRTYYAFQDINLDRYLVNGNYEQLEISARELDSNRLAQQAQTWVNQKLEYTHGYGVAASPVSAVQGEGLPEYVISDIPPQGAIEVTRPQIYFGESQAEGTYVVAPSAQKELDYPKGGDNVYTSYRGTHGVRMDATARFLWSLRLSDFNLLISPQLQDNSEVLYRRNIVDRAKAIAPFLTYDQRPYIVVDNGKLYWVLDAYTTANTYPYSQQDDSGINYIRNSVKVVIDAYEGTADFYIADAKDPLIKAYKAAFPSLFKPIDRMPAGLRAHLRVPQDYFKVQANVYRTYHITDPQVLYNREDVWDFPLEQTGPNSAPAELQPYYVLMRLPGEAQAEYLQILPFTPRGKPNMVSWLAARNDDPHYGEEVSYVLSKDVNIFGPQQVANRIQQNVDISRDFALFNTQGSQVVQGNLLVVPIGNDFLFFEPVYLQATGSTNIPELKKVILVDKDKVVYTDSLALALQQLVGQAPAPTPSPSGSPGPTPSPGTGTQAELLKQALQHYQLAQDALHQGDLATYQRELDEVGRILQQLNGASVSPRPTPSPGPSASGTRRPSTSPSR